MKRPARLAIAGLLVAAAAQAQLDPATFVSLGASVLKVEAVKAGGGYSIGSGVIVAPGKVVTNCHVTEDAREIRVIKAGGRLVASAQSADREHDLCLLRVPAINGDAVRLGRADALAVGQRLSAVGYTGGTGLSNSAGSVVALHRHDGSRVIQTDNWFNSGASGGGLFDARLQLVGILTFRLRGGRAHYFAAPIDWLRERIDDERGFEPVAPLERRAAYWQRPEPQQPNFLKAAVLEQRGRWDELEALAAQWSRDDASDSEAWYLLGVAAHERQRFDEARDALQRALQLEPRAAPAWYRLGVVCHRLALRDCSKDALDRLKPLDADLAHRLAKALEA